jgi:cytochrome P450 family 135
MSEKQAPPSHSARVFAQTVRFHRDPLGFLREAQSELGDVFMIRLLTARPLAVVADPRAVEALLASDYGPAHAGAARRAILPFASERSAFGGDGEVHRAARARIAPLFAREALAAKRQAMGEIATRHAASWPIERPFRLLERMRDITDEIFVRLVLGVDDERAAARLIESLRSLLNTPGNPPLTLPGRGDGLVGALGQRLFEHRQAPAARHLAEAIGADQETVDELMSLLMAAQEPPAMALAWLLDRIAREPQLVPAFREDPEGESAQSAVAETLRLQPSASAALRKLSQPFTAGGFELPAGITVLLPTALMQRDPRAYPNPDSFLPERWQHNAEAPAGFYFPFGGGERRCVGEPLARAEFAAVLPAVLRQVQLSPLATEPEPMAQRATVLVPKRSLLVRAIPLRRA